MNGMTKVAFNNVTERKSKRKYKQKWNVCLAKVTKYSRDKDNLYKIKNKN